jgi:PBSX family phage portal protein
MSKGEPDAFIVTKDDGTWDVVEKADLDRYAIKADGDSDGSKQIKSDGFDYNALYEPLYDPNQLLELLELNTFHADCCDAVARDAGGRTWTLNGVEGKDGLESTKRIAKSFLESVKDGLNSILYKRNYDRRAMGYGVIEIIRENKSKSNVINLSHIPSQHLRRAEDGIRVKQQIGTTTVWFILYGSNKDHNGNGLFDIHSEDGTKHPYNSLNPEERANELLWRMDYTPKSHYYGLAKIVPAIKAIHGDISRAEFNTSFFKNYGMPAFAVTVQGDFDPGITDPNDPEYDETKTLKYKISQQLKQVMKNPHSAVTVLIPSEGQEGNVEVKIVPLSVETKEASFRLFRKDNRDEVLAAHRVPGYRIGINETGALGGSNTGEATKIYKTSVIEPLQSDDEYDINLILRNEFGVDDWQFAVSEIDIRDMAGDILIAEKMFNMASMKPRQMIRYFGERFGLKDDPDNPYLDEYYLNGQPLDAVFANVGVDPPGTGNVLGQLESDLTGGGEVDEQDPMDGNESRAVKNAFNRLRNRVSVAVSR